MRKYEYKVVDTEDLYSAGQFIGIKREDVEAYLNSLGKQGWELVNADFREREGSLGFSGVMKKEL